MKDELRESLAKAGPRQGGLNLVREALQAAALASLQRSGAMRALAFQGGTALRFLFSLARFSEDLDFALENPAAGYELQELARQIKSDFLREGLDLELRLNDSKTVHSLWLRFPGLLFDLRLAPMRDQVLAIKLEVDTKPPAGAALATSIVRKHRILHLQHHDRASLLAGKLHAVLERQYFKGRDIYDLVWYLSDRDWPEPNLVLLNNALAQTGSSRPPLERATWRAAVREKLENADFGRLAADVAPFLERPEELALLEKEAVFQLL